MPPETTTAIRESWQAQQELRRQLSNPDEIKTALEDVADGLRMLTSGDFKPSDEHVIETVYGFERVLSAVLTVASY